MEKLRVDEKKGLNGGDMPDRTAAFGNNYRPPPQRTPCCTLFKEQLKDTMIQILLVCAVVSITIEMAFAESPEDYSHSKYNMPYRGDNRYYLLLLFGEPIVCRTALAHVDRPLSPLSSPSNKL